MSVSERSIALEAKTEDGNQVVTPLIIAARNGNLDSVKKLLSYRADIEARGTLKFEDKDNPNPIEGCTPLWAAAAAGHLDVVTFLIERNAEIDGRTSTKSTPLRAAAYKGWFDIVTYLVEKGADINATTEFESTPLMITCYKEHMSVATYLIEHGANVNLQDKKGDTALHYAAKTGHLEIVNKLLAFGAVQMPNFNRLTPLLSASNNSKAELVEYFCSRAECKTEQRIDALELLGATMAANEQPQKAYFYMKRGMEERFKDPSCPFLKKKMETLGAYQNRKESDTPDELSLLEDDNHAIRMEGLLIRERILGNDNEEIIFPIRYCGAVYADCGSYDLCIGLWRHAIQIAKRCNGAITGTVDHLVGVFAEMLVKNMVLRSALLKEVFDNLCFEYKRLQKQELQSRNLQEGSKVDELEKLLYYALKLLMLYTKVQGPEQDKADILKSVKKFLLLNPRSREDRKRPIDIAETDESRRILSTRKRLDLKCIAARAVQKFGLSYVGVVPETVEKFISLH
ncbi:protein fem-1 homolog B-like [Montipora capricornis]|uniref:protein fem-1 homolog B-like n=1 Tax=Montipora capricornis TaxID=246305 RepID=UPI0035F1CF0A